MKLWDPQPSSLAFLNVLSFGIWTLGFRYRALRIHYTICFAVKPPIFSFFKTEPYMLKYALCNFNAGEATFKRNKSYLIFYILSCFLFGLKLLHPGARSFRLQAFPMQPFSYKGDVCTASSDRAAS